MDLLSPCLFLTFLFSSASTIKEDSTTKPYIPSYCQIPRPTKETVFSNHWNLTSSKIGSFATLSSQFLQNSLKRPIPLRNITTTTLRWPALNRSQSWAILHWSSLKNLTRLHQFNNNCSVMSIYQSSPVSTNPLKSQEKKKTNQKT